MGWSYPSFDIWMIIVSNSLSQKPYGLVKYVISVVSPVLCFTPVRLSDLDDIRLIIPESCTDPKSHAFFWYQYFIILRFHLALSFHMEFLARFYYGEYGSIYFSNIFNVLYWQVKLENFPTYSPKLLVTIWFGIPTSWRNLPCEISTSLFACMGYTYVNPCPSINSSPHVLLRIDSVFAKNVSP